MKNYLSIFLLGSVLIFAGCGSTGEKKERSEKTSITAAEETSKAANKRAALEAERAAALDKLMAESNYYKNEAGKQVYYKAEVDPSYMGGDKAMNAFLKKNLKFPDDAEDEGLEGTVFVDFVVAENGEVTEVTATSHTYATVDNSFKDEALRVVNLMPDWTPGLQNGKAVDVKFSVPITFTMR